MIMNGRRRLLALAALGAVRAFGQAPRFPRRIVILEQWHSTSPSTPALRLVAELDALGHREGRDIAYEWRHPAGDRERLARYAQEIAASSPDAIVAMGGISTRAIADSAKSIPILAWVDDPVRAGLASVAMMPTGNVTGFADQGELRLHKALELLKAIIPGFRRFGVVEPAGNAFAREVTLQLASVAATLGVEVVPARFTDRNGIEAALSGFAKSGVRAALVWPSPVIMTLGEVVAAATRHGIALVGEGQGARYGVLLAFSPEIDARRLAVQLDKILRGVPVASIPFELPEKFVLEINRKTALALQVTIPPEIYLRATRVFDDWAK